MKFTHEDLLKNGYKLVFEDHFDNGIDDKVWYKFDTHNERGHMDRAIWRNPENIYTRDSNLIIKGSIDDDPENGGKKYNCGRIQIKNFTYKYGYAEARAKIAVAGPGIWMGFWMCARERDNGVNSEIDVAEMFGDDTRIASNIHGWWLDRNYGKQHRFNYLDGKNYPKVKELPNGERFSDKYHNFGYYWTPDFVEFLVDGESFCRVDIKNPMFALCHSPLYFIFSMLYGSKNRPQPIEDRTEPIEFCIDYLRLYQDDKGEFFDINEKGEAIKREK